MMPSRAKQVGWVVFETPVFVQVEYDDECADEDATKVIVVDDSDMRLLVDAGWPPVGSDP